MLAADGKKQEVRAMTHVSPQASILHWEAGLKPLYVGEVDIGDALNGRS